MLTERVGRKGTGFFGFVLLVFLLLLELKAQYYISKIKTNKKLHKAVFQVHNFTNATVPFF